MSVGGALVKTPQVGTSNARLQAASRSIVAMFRRSIVLIPGCLLAPIAAPACGYVTWFDSLAAWQAATDDDTVAVTFDEPVWPINQPLAGTWTVGGVAFTGLAGAPFPNIWVTTAASPFGSGRWLVANEDEKIDIVPLASTTAIAFEATANQFGPATITVLDLDGYQIGQLQIPTGTHRFVGVTSNVPIGTVNFSSVLGAVTDTGLDTVRLATRAAPVGDLNGDGFVDGADLGLLIANWGGSGAGDLNCDGVVDGADLGLLIAAWSE